MKIYFAGSIRGGRGDKVFYDKIISLLKAYGTVLTEHVGDQSLNPRGETENKDQSQEKIKVVQLELAQMMRDEELAELKHKIKLDSLRREHDIR